MLKHADFITVNSTFMKKEVEKIINGKNIEIIPMGAGIGDISEKENAERKQKTKTNILFVGRLIEWKGTNFLIDAVKLLDPSKFELHIAGDGPERENLEKTAPENVFFHGYQTGKNLEEGDRIRNLVLMNLDPLMITLYLFVILFYFSLHKFF